MFKLMLVSFNHDTGEFADHEFNRFCREHSIVRIEKEFINSQGSIYYSFFIEYQARRIILSNLTVSMGLGNKNELQMGNKGLPVGNLTSQFFANIYA